MTKTMTQTSKAKNPQARHKLKTDKCLFNKIIGEKLSSPRKDLVIQE